MKLLRKNYVYNQVDIVDSHVIKLYFGYAVSAKGSDRVWSAPDDWRNIVTKSPTMTDVSVKHHDRKVTIDVKQDKE